MLSCWKVLFSDIFSWTTAFEYHQKSIQLNDYVEFVSGKAVLFYDCFILIISNYQYIEFRALWV